MNAALLTGLIAALLLLGCAWLFGLGLWRALQHGRLRRRQRLLCLRVTAIREQGKTVWLLLARRRWRAWLPLPGWQAGQAIALQGPGAQRRYSLAGWRRWPLHYELAIKREPGGRVSNWAAGLRVGDPVLVSRPLGDFGWPPALRGELVLVAGGIGITPMRAMLQRWLAEAADRRPPCTLIWSFRDPADALHYHLEFEQLAASTPGLRYLALLTGGDTAWRGERGRLTLQRLRAAWQSPAPQGVWMCASQALMDALTQAWRQAGLPPQRLHQEAFGAAANADAARYAIRLQGDARTISFEGQRSLLDGLLAGGVTIASDCRNGSCGACRLRLLEGGCRTVLQAETPLPAGQALACCVVPTSDLLLAL